jgi:hypothetical protein
VDGDSKSNCPSASQSTWDSPCGVGREGRERKILTESWTTRQQLYTVTLFVQQYIVLCVLRCYRRRGSTSELFEQLIFTDLKRTDDKRADTRCLVRGDVQERTPVRIPSIKKKLACVSDWKNKIRKLNKNNVGGGK